MFSHANCVLAFLFMEKVIHLFLPYQHAGERLHNHLEFMDEQHPLKEQVIISKQGARETNFVMPRKTVWIFFSYVGIFFTKTISVKQR